MKNIYLLLPAAILLAGCSDRLSGSNTVDAVDTAGKRPGSTQTQTVQAPAGSFDATAAWPLCGRITENPPQGWNPNQGCPPARFGNASFTDAPFSSTFGPRQKASSSFRYDYHRGIDIPTPVGTPLFAIADGYVNKAGDDAGYYDPLIQVRHNRPGQASCLSKGCYYSNYLHISQWVVAAGQNVTKGQLIGYSGADGLSGFAHLHFEIRNAPGSHDAFGNTSRDAIHPLSALPYPDFGASNLGVVISSVDTSVPGQPDVAVSVTIPNGVELDLLSAEIAIFERQMDHTYSPVAQPGDISIGTTPEGTGYVVDPPSFDMVQWNRQYSYKNTSKFPYSSFRTGGAYQSPYASYLPNVYDANFHLDQTMDGDPKVGEFNGALIAPAAFNTQSAEYAITIRFTELVGPADPSRLCVKARARDVRGNQTTWVASNCPA